MNQQRDCLLPENVNMLVCCVKTCTNYTNCLICLTSSNFANLIFVNIVIKMAFHEKSNHDCVDSGMWCGILSGTI